jgi:hypothetical protein
VRFWFAWRLALFACHLTVLAGKIIGEGPWLDEVGADFSKPINGEQ